VAELAGDASMTRFPHFPFPVSRFTLILACFTLLLAATPCHAWMNPTRDRIDEANRLFKEGKYEDALAKYGDVLVDQPESPLLNFNMGDANYKAGKYAEAIASFSRVRPDDQAASRTAKAAYNIGNAEYRLAAAAEAEKPQDALKGYAAALVAYRRAIVADPADQDAKFNYEYVTKKIDELKKKLEEQQKQQDQQQQDQQQQDQQQQADQQEDQQPEQQQPPPDQQQPQAGQKDEQRKDQQKAPQQEPGEQDKGAQQQDAQAQQADGEQQEKKDAAAASAAGTSGGENQDKMSRQEAAALIDTAKNDELRPDEFARQVQGGRVAEPTQDW
jgi:Ca-activated chloride channel family protein